MTTTPAQTQRRRNLHYEIELAKARREWQRVELLTLRAYSQGRRVNG